MEKFTSIDEVSEATSFLKRTADNYYSHLTAWDTLPERDIMSILDKARKLYSLNENSKGTLLEKKMLYD